MILFYSLTSLEALRAIQPTASLLPYPVPLLILYLNFLFLVQFLPLFIFYSFNYTIKSGGVCNRLPHPTYRPVLPAYRLRIDCVSTAYHLRITLFWFRISLPFHLFPYLPHVYRETLELHLQSSRSLNSTTLHCYRYPKGNY